MGSTILLLILLLPLLLLLLLLVSIVVIGHCFVPAHEFGYKLCGKTVNYIYIYIYGVRNVKLFIYGVRNVNASMFIQLITFDPQEMLNILSHVVIQLFTPFLMSTAWVTQSIILKHTSITPL